MKNALLVLLLAALSAAPSFAQSAAAPSSAPEAAAPFKNPVLSSVRLIFPNRQKNTLAALEAMPADKYAYKPTPDQMSFAHLAIHIVEFNNAMCSTLVNVPAPKVDELKETDPKDKLVAAARASFDFCSQSIANADDAALGDSVNFFGRAQGPRAMAALILASGWADHYATAAMYLRLNNILPPTAQPKK